MNMEVDVSLSDILEVLNLKSPPEGCEYKLGEDVAFDVVIDDDDAIEELERKGYYLTEEFREELPLHELKDAFAALKSGDYLLARTLFCRMLDDAEFRVVEDSLMGQEQLPRPMVAF